MRCASPPDSVVAGWPEAQVAEADLVEDLQAAQHLRRRAEEGQRLAHGHVEDLVDVAPAVLDLEHLRLEPLAFADLARHEDVGEELHLDLDHAFALARLAAPAGHVEREVAGRQAARLRVLGRREQLADRIERLEIRDRVGSRRAADRRLVHEDDVGDELRPFELAVRADAAIPVALGALQRGVDHVVDERALARAADAGHAGQHAERNLDVDVLEVVLRRAEDPQPLVRSDAAASAGTGNRELVAEVLRGQRARLLQQLLERAARR